MEEGLKGQIPPHHASGGGGTAFFSTGDRRTSFRFNPRNANEVFAEFFQSSNPSRGTGRGNGVRKSSVSFGDSPFRTFGEGGVEINQVSPHKDAPVEKKLHCTLEDIYKGANNKIRISRDIVDANNR